MTATEAKCSCQHCSEHIAFEPMHAGQMTTCPHCGMDTKLFIPPRAPSRAATPSVQENVNAWIAAAYIFAFLIPIIGIILGINLISKKQNGHAFASIFLSIVVGVIAYEIISSGP